MLEKRKKWGLVWLDGGVGGLLDGPCLTLGSERKKNDQKLGKKACEVIFQGCRRIIQDYMH